MTRFSPKMKGSFEKKEINNRDIIPRKSRAGHSCVCVCTNLILPLPSQQERSLKVLILWAFQILFSCKLPVLNDIMVYSHSNLVNGLNYLFYLNTLSRDEQYFILSE